MQETKRRACACNAQANRKELYGKNQTSPSRCHEGRSWFSNESSYLSQTILSAVDEKNTECFEQYHARYLGYCKDLSQASKDVCWRSPLFHCCFESFPVIHKPMTTMTILNRIFASKTSFFIGFRA